MADGQPVADGGPSPKTAVCPDCGGPMLTTEQGSVCWACKLIVAVLVCFGCGRRASWQPKLEPGPRWARLMGEGWTVVCCCGECAMLAVDQMVLAGQLAGMPGDRMQVLPDPAPRTTPIPEQRS